LRQYSNRERPFHLGPLPLERLRRTAFPLVATGELPRDEHLAGEQGVAQVIPEYIELFGKCLAGSAAKAAAPVPVDPAVRANNLKAHAYFLDAVLVGCCQIEPVDWATVDNPGHRYACVFVVEFGREPRAGEPGDLWIRGCNEARNERDLNLGREQKLASIQKLALYPPQLQPKGGVTVSETVPVDRAAGLKLYATAESPDAARARDGREVGANAE
jgi:hypothetical protein